MSIDCVKTPLPAGLLMFFDAATCPAGWQQAAATQGRLLVALPQVITFLQLPSSLVGPLQGLIFTSLVILFLFLRPHGLIGKRMPGAAH